MADIVLVIGDRAVSATELFAVGLGIVVVLLVALAVGLARSRGAQAREAERAVLHAQELEERMGELARIQAETAGRLASLGETLAGRQSELARTVSERLDAVSLRVGQAVETTSRTTGEQLKALGERLAVIDAAQKTIGDLSSQVGSLREILSNKQARGAFGQGRMEAIVRDGLPAGAFDFQATLSNRTRPDCVIHLPGDDRPLVIDAKFPLEAVTAFRDARTEEARKAAATRVRQDVAGHVQDIASRYLIPGETQDTALMFVPSESVYADLQEHFDEVVQKANRARVVIVSPSLLALAIQVTQSLVKDQRMREAAHAIRTEVGHLVADVGRLGERVRKLDQHFSQVTDDVTQIAISADKITKRGSRIEALDFEEAPAAAGAPRRPVPVTLPRRLEAGE